MFFAQNKQMSNTLEQIYDLQARKLSMLDDFVLMFPDEQSGSEKLLFKIGDKVASTGKGAIKEGVIFTIEDTDLVNGYARYYGCGMWHLQQDVMPYSE